jgi:hypothetical protein
MNLIPTYSRFLALALKPIFISLFILLPGNKCFGQEKPPIPVTVYVNPAQGLIFGAFYLTGTGGTVVLSSSGARSSTGNVILANLGFSFSPAIFQVTANRGAVITILNGPDVTLNGSNGGTLSLHIGSSDVGSPFISTVASPGYNSVHIGGTLTVGSTAANPPGNYSGSFSVTFIQQ